MTAADTMGATFADRHIGPRPDEIADMLAIDKDRVTVELKRADGRTIHVRKATRPEPRQQVIYDALGVNDRPGPQQVAVI